MAQAWLSNSKFNQQQNRSQISKGGSSWITRASNNASNMDWDGNNTATAYDASSRNPLSPEFYISNEKWGNGAIDLGTYLGLGYSVNRYVSMADFSLGGTYDTGRYHGAPGNNGTTSNFNYRWNMNAEAGYAYGRDTKTTCPKMELFHSFYLYNYYYFFFL